MGFSWIMQPVILKEVQILNCVSNCSGAALFNTKPFDFNAPNWTGTFFWKTKENPNYYIGSGLSVCIFAAYILDSVFYNHYSMKGAFLVPHSSAIITNNTQMRHFTVCIGTYQLVNCHYLMVHEEKDVDDSSNRTRI